MIEVVETYFKNKARKKPWIFYCEACGERVSTDTQTRYYEVRGRSDQTEFILFKRLCSAACAEGQIPQVLCSIYEEETSPPHGGVIMITPELEAQPKDGFEAWRQRREAVVGQVVYRTKNRPSLSR